MIVEIDPKSGFCFGVQKAIEKAEEALANDGMLYSLGAIVHNEQEVLRLEAIGLRTITSDEFFALSNCKVLIRAHGEPPSTYEHARRNNIELIDATCPVVLKLQQRVKKAADTMSRENGQVVIFGHQGHAEVTGLTGQTNNQAIVIDNPDDFQKIDLTRPIELFSQTTKSVADFKKLTGHIQTNAQSGRVDSHDTICRQVSNRAQYLREFASHYDAIVFVGGKSSSNAGVLFDECKAENEKSYFITSSADIDPEWFLGIDSVGVCGATSTPEWLMTEVAKRIKQF